MSDGNIFPGKQNKPNAWAFSKILKLNLPWTYLFVLCRQHLKQVETQKVSDVNTSAGSRTFVQGCDVFRWILVSYPFLLKPSSQTLQEHTCRQTSCSMGECTLWGHVSISVGGCKKGHNLGFGFWLKAKPMGIYCGLNAVRKWGQVYEWLS